MSSQAVINPPKATGRPKLQLKEREIANYAKLGASNREIAGMMGCDEGTIRGRFSALLTKARSSRKISLRKLQWAAAKKGNPALLIFLGKNELEQTDKSAVEHTGTDGKPIEVTHKFDDARFAELYQRRTRGNLPSPQEAAADRN
jgi:DNA-binding CsgD family transcriptional regulator